MAPTRSLRVYGLNQLRGDMMKPVKFTVLGALAMALSLPTQAWAVFCTYDGPTAGYVAKYEDGERVLVPDTDAQAEMDLQRLRQIGVPATSVERWNGCLRAFVQQPTGGETMEFYDPASLRRLQ
jgi:hypothetical protein